MISDTLGIACCALGITTHRKKPGEVFKRLILAQAREIPILAVNTNKVPQLFSRRIMVKNRLHTDTL
ncbi:MAG: hypothetical protein C1943_15535 [Halochromatium sp.]|nr:hypothetical protein [Halochromatium sp.]